MIKNKLFMSGLGLFSLLVLLLWAGLLPGFTFVLGIVAFVCLIVLIRSNIEAGFWRSASMTGLVLLLFFLNIWSLVLGLFPLSTQTIKDRKGIIDVQIYETFHAPAGISLRDLREACDSAETKAANLLRQEYGEWVTEARVKEMLNSTDVEEKAFAPRQEDDKLRAKIVALKKWRADCSQFILDHTPKNLIAATRDYLKSLKVGIVGWIAILVFLDLGGIAISWAIQDPKNPEWSLFISKLTFAIVMTLGVYLIGTWIVSTDFSIKEVIEGITISLAPSVEKAKELHHDIIIAITLGSIVAVAGFTAGAVTGIKKGGFPAWCLAGLSLAIFVLYQLLFVK